MRALGTLAVDLSDTGVGVALAPREPELATDQVAGRDQAPGRLREALRDGGLARAGQAADEHERDAVRRGAPASACELLGLLLLVLPYAGSAVWRARRRATLARTCAR